MTSKLDTAVSVISSVVGALAPFATVAEAALPAQAAAIEIGIKIFQAALALEPKAAALVQQVLGGTPLSVDQVQQYVDTYSADDDRLNADLAALIAKLTPQATA